MSYIDQFDVKQRYSFGQLFEFVKGMEDAMNNDMAIQVTPATLGTEVTPSNAAFSRTVQVKLVNSDGDILRFFNGVVDVATSDVTNSTGASNILDSATEITLVNGVGEVTVEYADIWEAGDTQTTEVGSVSIMGYTVAQSDSVDTIAVDA